MNDETLYNKIKQAAKNAENKDFRAMDKVWNRIDEKLDSNVLVKQKYKWKKLAIAASVLLVVSLAFLVNNREAPTNNQEQIVVADSLKIIDTSTRIVIQENRNPMIKDEAPAILRKQIEKTSAVAVEQATISDVEVLEPIQTTESLEEKRVSNKVMHIAPNFEARGVQRINDNIVIEAVSAKKETPLLVVDGEAVKEGRQYQKSLDAALKQVANGDEDIIVLTEPLYIINGVHYSEQEMFGENPTSPYAPLTKQEIETLTILQGEKAISIYGKKGSKGVVLITTKGGKPAAATRR